MRVSRLSSRSFAAMLGITALLASGCADGPAGPDQPGPVTTLVLTTAPAGAASGVAFVTQPVVALRDAQGRLVPTATHAVTARLASGGGSLAGTTTVKAVGGVVTFTDLAIAGTIGDRTLTFTVQEIPGATVTSAPLPLEAGPAATLAPAELNRTMRAGVPFGVALFVLDASGNRTASVAEVAATAPAGIALGGTTTVRAVDGVAIFDSLVMMGTAGPRSLTFSATLAGASRSLTIDSLTLTPGLPARLEVVPDTDVVVGQTNVAVDVLDAPPAVRVLDAWGNLVTNDTVTVTALVGNVGVTRVAGDTTQETVNGIATFSGLTLASKTGRAEEDGIFFVAPGLDTAAVAVALSCQGYELPGAGSVARTLRAGDCTDAYGVEYHATTITASGQVSRRFTMTSSAFQPAFYLKSQSMWRNYWGFVGNAATNTMTLRYLGAEPEVAGMAGAATATIGAYQLTSEVVPDDVPGCVSTFLGGDVTTTQSLTTEDCTSSGYHGDVYPVVIENQWKVEVTVTGAGYLPYLVLYRYDAAGNVKTADGVCSGTTCTLAWHNQTGADGFYYLYVGADQPNTVGTYTLAFSYPPTMLVRRGAARLTGAMAPARHGVPSRPPTVVRRH